MLEPEIEIELELEVEIDVDDGPTHCYGLVAAGRAG